MNDKEIIKLCAEAMKLNIVGLDSNGRATKILEKTQEFVFLGNPFAIYDPLDEDEQAMALIKKFSPRIERRSDGPWVVWNWQSAAHSESLNRAICEFVAKMQKAENKTVDK